MTEIKKGTYVPHIKTCHSLFQTPAYHSPMLENYGKFCSGMFELSTKYPISQSKLNTRKSHMIFCGHYLKDQSSNWNN